MKTLMAMILTSVLLISLVGCNSSSDSSEQADAVTVERLGNGPVLSYENTRMENIQGPSILEVPEWIEDSLGKYYLYFASHKGDAIYMAYSDNIEGPYTVYDGGVLSLADSTFITEDLKLTPAQLAYAEEVARQTYGGDVELPHSLEVELSHAHIASPEIVADEETGEILMYFHGVVGLTPQQTRLAVSRNGLDFTVNSKENLGNSYMRMFDYDGYTYSIGMPGQTYRSVDGRTNFEKGIGIFPNNTRHMDLYLEGDTLFVFYTMVGDAPEQIYMSTIDVSKPWGEWKPTERIFVMKPELGYEGANAPVIPSMRSTAYNMVNQLRDPNVITVNGQTYLFYAVAGESGIALAEITVK